MSFRTLRAHFDGEHIYLDEPCQLQPDTKLLIIVLPKQPEEEDRRDWLRIAQGGLEAAYGSDEPEYSLEMIKEPNPDYERK